MESASVLGVSALLLGLVWFAYARSNLRRWSVQRDPLGEPPLRAVALVLVLVAAVGLASVTGGGEAGQAGSMQQGLEDDDGAFETAEASGTAVATGASVAVIAQPAQPAAGSATAAAADTTKAERHYGKLAVRARRAAEARRRARQRDWDALVERADRAARARARR